MPASVDELLHTLTKVCNTLSRKDIRFAVAGGCAVYARGGPATDHDVDVFVRPADVHDAARALVESGMRAAHPPEDWLTKVYDGDRLVDLVYRPNFRAGDDSIFERASWMRIGPTSALVISGTDLLIDKLLVLDAHRLDLTPLVRIARALREQVEWPEVRRSTAMSPYARAFLRLTDDLAITRHPEGDESMETDNMLPQYIVARLRRAFAEDPRTAELGVSVTIRGDVVYLTGEVSGAECVRDLTTIVHEQLPDIKVHNDVRVVETPEPHDAEDVN